MEDVIFSVIGENGKALFWYQMCARGIIVYICTIFFIRISNKRIFGKHSAFDIVMGIILGSVLSRAITGNAPFFETLLTGLVLVLLHRIFAVIAYHQDSFGRLIKGNEILLMEDGDILWDNMKKKSISRNDLQEAVRAKSGTVDMDKVERAYLERNGDISIITKSDD